jgi:hypothetical protein
MEYKNNNFIFAWPGNIDWHTAQTYCINANDNILCSFDMKYETKEETKKETKKEDKEMSLIPVKIIYNKKTTICIWEDGSKTVVHCGENEEPFDENGVAMCVAKKVFGSRMKFLKAVNKGYHQPEKIVKNKE